MDDLRSRRGGVTLSRTAIAVACCAALGLALRVAAARDQPWLDEVWSIELARSAGSFAGIFTKLHHDNNHFLNTAWLRLVGEHAPPLLLRALSISAGAMAIVATAWLTSLCVGVEARSSRVEPVLGALVAAATFPLVQHGSEARGYALAVLATLLLPLAVARCLEAPSWRRASLVWAIAIGGVLSHLTFAGPLAGALAWAAWRWRRAPRSHVRDALVLFAAPLLAVALLWAVSLRGITTGGGPLRSPAGAMVTAASMALGGPMSGPLAAAAAVGALLVAAWGVLLLARRGADVAVYFAATLVAGPAALVLTTRSLAFPRYLLVQVALVPVLAALVLGVAWNRRGAARLVAVAALAAVLASHLVRDAKLIAIGRGDGASVVRAILDGTPGGGPIVVGGDSDFANRTMLEWHAARAPGGERLHYADAALWPADGPDWLLTITFDEDAVPPREIANASGSRRYALDFIAPHSGLSGWTWSAYRRAR